jgi:protein ImuA
MPPLAPPHAQIVRELKQRLSQVAEAGGVGRLSTGCRALDRLLPGAGLRPGTLVEYVSAGAGCGAAWLALLAARHASGAQASVVWIDRQGEFYPPAAAEVGLDLARLVIVRPACQSDFLWAWDQSLRCPGVAAVVGDVEHVSQRTYRRWQLAAEEGGGLGLLIRPPAAAGQPSWAETRWLVQCRGRGPAVAAGPLARLGVVCWHVELLRCRGLSEPRGVELYYDATTGALRLATELAPASAAESRHSA